MQQDQQAKRVSTYHRYSLPLGSARFAHCSKTRLPPMHTAGRLPDNLPSALCWKQTITSPQQRTYRVDAAMVDEVDHWAHGILLQLVAEQQLIYDVEQEHSSSSAQSLAQVSTKSSVDQH